MTGVAAKAPASVFAVALAVRAPSPEGKAPVGLVQRVRLYEPATCELSPTIGPFRGWLMVSPWSAPALVLRSVRPPKFSQPAAKVVISRTDLLDVDHEHSRGGSDPYAHEASSARSSCCPSASCSSSLSVSFRVSCGILLTILVKDLRTQFWSSRGATRE